MVWRMRLLGVAAAGAAAAAVGYKFAPAAFSRSAADSTAMGVALMRRVASLNHNPAVKVDDPASACFLSTTSRFITGTSVGGRFIRWTAGKMCPGAFEMIVYRTRHYDRLINDAVANGARQLVVLGAGYTTYGHRLPSVAAGGVDVYEVDLPAIQEKKLAKLSGCEAEGLLKLNPKVRHTPINFANETIGEVLRAAGFDTAAPTVFAWEGVSMYVPEEGVRTTLKSVRSIAAPGSTLAFSYVFREMIEDYGASYSPQSCPAAIPFADQARSKGEPWHFGIGSCLKPSDTTELKALLAEFGFELTEALTMEEAARKLFAAKDGSIGLTMPEGVAHEAIARLA